MKLKSFENQTARAVTRGILHAVIASLVLVFLFALIILVAGLPSSAIKPGTQVIKVFSIFWGVAVALRGVGKRGWVFGALVGLLYTVIIFFVFSIISSDFGLVSGLLTDCLFACVIGVFSAMILKTLRSNAV